MDENDAQLSSGTSGFYAVLRGGPEPVRNLRPLGVGGTGNVYLVDRENGDEAALKVFAGDSGGQVRRHEGNLLAGLEHEHLVSHYGWASSDVGVGLLMEYLPGGTAETLVQRTGRLGPGEAITAVAPIASAVAYLHSCEVSHGDIAPGNVLFTADGRPKLSDLGLSAMPGRRGQRAGTPGFVAPEIGHGTAVDDGLERQAADVYSLAALTWYLLTGYPAEPAIQRPPLPSLRRDIPADAAALIERGLEDDPRERPTAAEFWHEIFVLGDPAPLDLTAAVDTNGLARLVTSAVEPPKRGARRSRRQLAKRWPGSRPWIILPVLPWRHLVLAGALIVAVGAGLWFALAVAPGLAPEAGREATAVNRESSVAPEPTGSAPPDPDVSGHEETTLVRDESTALLNDLAARRTEALMERDASALADIYVDEAAAQPDRDVIEALESRGERYRDLTLTLQVDAVTQPDAATRVVEASSQISGYDVVSDNGEVLHDVKAPAEQQLTLTLIRIDGGEWKIASLTASEPS